MAPQMLPQKVRKQVERLLPKPKKADKNAGLVKLCQDKYDIARRLKEPEMRKWILNLAFIAGYQYVFFNNALSALQRIKKIKGRRRSVDNIIKPKFKRQVADFVRSSPEMSVVPNTTDEEDVRAAKLGDLVLSGFWVNRDMRGKHREMGSWIFSCGNVFLGDLWNKKLGNSVITADGDIVYEGDVDCEVISPIEFGGPIKGLSDPDIHGLPWIIISQWKPIEYFHLNFGSKGAEVVPESMPQHFSDAALYMRDIQGGTPDDAPGALYHRLYIQPCVEYKKGLYIEVAGTVLLSKDDFPHLEYPFEHFGEIPVAGKFWYQATTEDAVPLQVRWNRTLNDIDEYNRTIAKGKMLVPRNSKTEVIPDDTTGEMVVYKPVMGHKPEIMTQKNHANSLLEMLQAIKVSLEDLYAQHEVTRGTNKSDIRSGEMVDLLLDQDRIPSITLYDIYEQKMEKVMHRVLRRIAVGYKDARYIKIAGEEGEWLLQSFKGADLRNNNDVRIERESSIPDSRLMREQRIERRFGLGLYGNPQDPEVRRKVLRMLDDAVVKDVYDEKRRDESVARWENMMFLSGAAETYFVNDYDNHAVHMKEHNAMRKSIKYQRLKIENPQAFMLFESIIGKHMQMHQRFHQEQIARMLRMQAMAQGGSNGRTSSGGQNPNTSVQRSGR